MHILARYFDVPIDGVDLAIWGFIVFAVAALFYFGYVKTDPPLKWICLGGLCALAFIVILRLLYLVR